MRTVATLTWSLLVCLASTPASAADRRGTEDAPVVVKVLPAPPTAADRRGTADAPIVIRVLPAPLAPAEVELQTKDRDARATSDAETSRTNQWLIAIGVGQLIVFLGQLLVFGYQAKKLRETVDAAAEQATEMRLSVAEAARAATAMERLADQMTRTAEANAQAFANQKEVFQKQLRAYINLNGQALVAQLPDAQIALEVRTIIENLGNTPARSVNFSSRLAILPAELPSDFGFTLPESPVDSAAVLFPRQTLTYRTWLPAVVTDDELTELKRGNSRKLYIYGVIRYKDTFDNERYTNFGKFVTWDVKDNAQFVNLLRQNEYS
jgi:Sec-independent protein translocase protein TatA